MAELRRPLLLLLCGSLFGCDASAPADSDSSRGYADWTATEELRLGSLDDSVYSFAPIGAVAVGPDRTMYTAHPQERLIRRWSVDGAPDGTIGGRGQGPGEFASIGAIGFTGDSLWAMDLQGQRVTYFDLTGTVLGTTPLEIDTRAQLQDLNAGRPYPLSVLPDGTFYGRQAGLIPQIAGTDSTRILHLHLDATSAILDTLFVQVVHRRDALAVQSPTSGGWLMGAQPYADAPVASAEPSLQALLVAERPSYTGNGTPTFRVTRISMSGDTVFHRTLPYDAEALPAEIVDRVIAGMVNRWEAQESDGEPASAAALTRLARDALYAPAWYPPFSAVVLGRDGTIWLRGAHATGGRIIWTVLDAEGHPAGRVDLPASLRVLVATRDRVWGVQSDRLGVSYLSRFSVGPEATDP